MATQKKKSSTKSSAGKKASAKKNTSAKSTSSGKGKGTAAPKKKEIQKNDRTTATILAIIFIVVGVLLFAAVQFNIAGSLGNLIGSFFKGTMGFAGILFPLYMVLFGVIMLVNKSDRFSKLGFAMGFLILLVISVIDSGHFIDSSNISFDAKTLYDSGIKLESGGLFGMMLAGLMVKYLGKIGLYLISFAILVILFIILMRNTPAKKFMNSVTLWSQGVRLRQDERTKERDARREEEREQKKKIEENRERMEANRQERIRAREEERSRMAEGGWSDAAEYYFDPNEEVIEEGSAEPRIPDVHLFPEGHTAMDDTTILDHSYSTEKKAPAITLLGQDVIVDTSNKVKSSPVDIDIETGSGEKGLEPAHMHRSGTGLHDTVELSAADKQRLQEEIRKAEEKQAAANTGKGIEEGKTSGDETKPVATEPKAVTPEPKAN